MEFAGGLTILAAMKISGPDSSRPVEARRVGKRGDKGGGDAFKVGEGDGDSAAAPITGSKQVAPVGSLLALQEVSDALDGPSRGLAHGRNLLEMLDQVRLGLLMGRVPEAQLQRIVHALETRRAGFGDPRIDLAVREIETRAAVELAKFDKIRAQNR